MARNQLTSPMMNISRHRRQLDFQFLPISFETRNKIAQSLLPSEPIKHLTIDYHRSEEIETMPVETFASDRSSPSVYFTEEMGTFFNSVGFYVFGKCHDRCAYAVEKCARRHKTDNNDFDLKIVTAFALNTSIYILTDYRYSPTLISPAIIRERHRHQINTGAILLLFDTKTRKYSPVIGYNWLMLSQSGQVAPTSFVLTGDQESRVSIPVKDLARNASSCFQYYSRYRSCIETEMNQELLDKFAAFVRDPDSFVPQIETDAKLYRFSANFRIRKMSAIIREVVFAETDPARLLLFLNDSTKLETQILDHFLRVLRDASLQKLESLPDSIYRDIQERKQTLRDFRRQAAGAEFLEPFLVMRISETEVEVFGENLWLPLPTNYFVQSIFHHLRPKSQKHIMYGRFLVFLREADLGYIDLLSPCDEPRFCEIPPGGPHPARMRLFVSNYNNLYLFQPDEKMFAPIDKTFRIGNWSKLQEGDFVRKMVKNTAFEMWSVGTHVADSQADLFFEDPDWQTCENILLLNRFENQLAAERDDSLYFFEISRSLNTSKRMSARDEDAGTSVTFVRVPMTIDIADILGVEEQLTFGSDSDSESSDFDFHMSYTLISKQVVDDLFTTMGIY